MENVLVSQENSKVIRSQFIARNKRFIIGFIEIFDKSSYHGLVSYYSLLGLMTVLLLMFIKSEIFSAILFTSGFTILSFLFLRFLISSKVKTFQECNDNLLGVVDKEKLNQLLKVFKRFQQFLKKSHKSLFVNRNLLSVSESLSAVFGVMLLLRRIQFCALAYLMLLVSTVYFCVLTSGLVPEGYFSHKHVE